MMRKGILSGCDLNSLNAIATTLNHMDQPGMAGVLFSIQKKATYLLDEYEEQKHRTVDVLMEFFPDEPCNYNGMDELADCEYCSKNCGNHDPRECWQNAIDNKWYEKMLP